MRARSARRSADPPLCDRRLPPPRRRCRRPHRPGDIHRHCARLATSVQVTRWLAASDSPSSSRCQSSSPSSATATRSRSGGTCPRKALHPCPPTSGAAPQAAPAGSAAISSACLPAALIRPRGDRVQPGDQRRRTGLAQEPLRKAPGRLRPAQLPLPAGMIHGDAWRGNLLRDGHRVVLADWDEVSTGPREIDLVPTLQGTRFGLPEPSATPSSPHTDTTSGPGTATQSCTKSGSCPPPARSCAKATQTRLLSRNYRSGSAHSGPATTSSGRPSDALAA